MTGYGVKIVGDDALPNDMDWMFVKQSDGSLTLYLSRSAAGCARPLAEAWAAFRSMESPSPPVQGQQGRPRLLSAV